MVSLKELVESIGFGSDKASYQLNLKTGEILFITDEELSIAENCEDLGELPEWQKEMVSAVQDYLKNVDDYIALPNGYDVDEYSVMEDFIDSLSDDNQQQALLKAISGKGAFRRFKDKIDQLEIANEWYKFKDAALTDYAKEWAKENDIELSE